MNNAAREGVNNAAERRSEDPDVRTFIQSLGIFGLAASWHVERHTLTDCSRHLRRSALGNGALVTSESKHILASKCDLYCIGNPAYCNDNTC